MTYPDIIVDDKWIARAVSWKDNPLKFMLALNKAELALARHIGRPPHMIKRYEKLLVPIALFEVAFLPYLILVSKLKWLMYERSRPKWYIAQWRPPPTFNKGKHKR